MTGKWGTRLIGFSWPLGRVVVLRPPKGLKRSKSLSRPDPQITDLIFKSENLDNNKECRPSNDSSKTQRIIKNSTLSSWVSLNHFLFWIPKLKILISKWFKVKEEINFWKRLVLIRSNDRPNARWKKLTFFMLFEEIVIFFWSRNMS